MLQTHWDCGGRGCYKCNDGFIEIPDKPQPVAQLPLLIAKEAVEQAKNLDETQLRR